MSRTYTLCNDINHDDSDHNSLEPTATFPRLNPHRPPENDGSGSVGGGRGRKRNAQPRSTSLDTRRSTVAYERETRTTEDRRNSYSSSPVGRRDSITQNDQQFELRDVLDKYGQGKEVEHVRRSLSRSVSRRASPMSQKSSIEEATALVIANDENMTESAAREQDADLAQELRQDSLSAAKNMDSNHMIVEITPVETSKVTKRQPIDHSDDAKEQTLTSSKSASLFSVAHTADKSTRNSVIAAVEAKDKVDPKSKRRRSEVRIKKRKSVEPKGDKDKGIEAGIPSQKKVTSCDLCINSLIQVLSNNTLIIFLSFVVLGSVVSAFWLADLIPGKHSYQEGQYIGHNYRSTFQYRAAEALKNVATNLTVPVQSEVLTSLFIYYHDRAGQDIFKRDNILRIQNLENTITGDTVDTAFQYQKWCFRGLDEFARGVRTFC